MICSIRFERKEVCLASLLCALANLSYPSFERQSLGSLSRTGFVRIVILFYLILVIPNPFALILDPHPITTSHSNAMLLLDNSSSSGRPQAASSKQQAASGK